jgi:hypothetical protein
MRNMNVRDPGRTVVSSSHPKPLDIMSEFKSLYQKENDVASNQKTHEKVTWFLSCLRSDVYVVDDCCLES